MDILTLLIGVIVFVLLLALIIKKEYKVLQEIIIEKPKNDVFNYIKLLKNQDNFSKWAKMDPSMKKTFSGTDGTVGFLSEWKSKNKNVGQGEQEIVGIIDGERIDYQLRFLKPFKSVSPAFISTQSLSNNKTRVAWVFRGKMKWPMNLLLPVINMEKTLARDLSIGLKNLKIILEK